MDVPPYREIDITGKESPRCVDGRKSEGSQKGPQMLGGSLHPVILAAVFRNSAFNSQFIVENMQVLKDAGFGMGVHRGSHKHGVKSDCGFSDNLKTIFAKVGSARNEIIKIIKQVYADNSGVLGQMAEGLFEQAFTAITAYPAENLQLTGEALIAEVAKTEGAQVIDLQGEHREKSAFVNLKKGATYDTNEADQAGQQAFNLDLWAVKEQAEALGVDNGFATAASLIFYTATEMVLVEDKGKARVPVKIHSPQI